MPFRPIQKAPKYPGRRECRSETIEFVLLDPRRKSHTTRDRMQRHRVFYSTFLADFNRIYEFKGGLGLGEFLCAFIPVSPQAKKKPIFAGANTLYPNRLSGANINRPAKNICRDVLVFRSGEYIRRSACARQF
jgi:hypothetical protein